MKKLFLLFGLLLSASFGFSQCELIPNQSFENFTCGAPSVHLLSNSCALPWGCFHRSPEVAGQPGGSPNNFGPACDGDVFVTMNASNEDAIFFTAPNNSGINFGDFYEFSFCVKSLAPFENPNASSTVSYTIYAIDNALLFPTCAVWPNDAEPIVLPSAEFRQEIASGSLDYTGEWSMISVPSTQINPAIAVTPDPAVTFLILSNSESTSNAWLGFDNFCVQEGECTPTECSSESNLTTCSQTNSTGYVYVNCPEASVLGWDIPTGSSAIQIGSNNETAIVNASPGTYILRTIGPDGCENTEEFVIVENCCQIDPNACNPPTNLNCTLSEGYLGMMWDEVPSATSYQVKIIYDDNGPSGCGCGGENYGVEVINTTVNSAWIYPGFKPCLSWQVKAICGEEEQSDWSEVMCYSGGQRCDSKVEGHSFSDENGLKKQSLKSIRPSIYPNPTSGQFNYEIELERAGNLQIQIFDTQGKLVQQFNFENQEAGLFKTELEVRGASAAGLYIINTKTDQFQYQERLMIID